MKYKTKYKPMNKNDSQPREILIKVKLKYNGKKKVANREVLSLKYSSVVLIPKYAQ